MVYNTFQTLMIYWVKFVWAIVHRSGHSLQFYYLFQFGRDFLDDFSELLRRRFGTKRVHANVVYQEYIADKQHTHMNATQWETLTDFVTWMGKEGTVALLYMF